MEPLKYKGVIRRPKRTRYLWYARMPTYSEVELLDIPYQQAWIDLKTNDHKEAEELAVKLSDAYDKAVKLCQKRWFNGYNIKELFRVIVENHHYSGDEEEDNPIKPSHYVGKTGIKAIDVVEDFDLNHRLSTAVEYILRSKFKHDSPVDDLRKAIWFLEREIIKNEQ